MGGFASQYFLDLVIFAMAGFSATMIFVCVEDATRRRDDRETR